MTGETELDRLIAVANSDGKARTELAGCVDRPHQVQTARAALAHALSLRAALKARRSPLGNGSAQ